MSKNRKNGHNYLRNGLTDLHEIQHGDPHWTPEPDLRVNVRTFKNPRWRTTPRAAIVWCRHCSPLSHHLGHRACDRDMLAGSTCSWEIHSHLYCFTFYFVHNILFIICPIAIAYSMGQIIKSFCVCACVLCVRLQTLSRSHFFVDFHQIGHRRVNPQK